DACGAHTVPYIEVENPSSSVEHEASTTKVSEEQVFYAQTRGLSAEAAQTLIINGFVRDVVKRLPLEFAVEANRLLELNLEGAVG
ncbi:MAG: SufD family Fe-S cluster assembly protein, partial [Chloroflexi bacterium]|nr:SufD family Fe-S cluster assembly protein [Chloroflexota bacterium]